MPPKGSRKAPLRPEDAELQGNTLLQRFFAPIPLIPKPGRPPGTRVEKRGRPSGKGTTARQASQESEVAAAAAADGDVVEAREGSSPAAAALRYHVLFTISDEEEGAADPGGADTGAAPTGGKADVSGDPAADVAGAEMEEVDKERASSKKKRSAGASRTNWSKGDALASLTKAVKDWLAKTGDLLSADPKMSLHTYARRVNIPKATLGNYVHPDESKRRKLGSQAGHPSLLDDESQRFVVDVLRRRDRGNDGMSRRDTINMLQDVKPDFSRLQLSDCFRNTVRKRHGGVLTNIVKAQASTTKRGQITVAQQFRWHTMVDTAFRLLRTWNTGALPDGRTFPEVMEHFVAGGDETCFLASAGDVKIIGDKKKKKHELASANSRVSTTIYRVGFASGATGPTAFLPPGVRRKTGYTDKFLTDHGAAPGTHTTCDLQMTSQILALSCPGSTIAMTPTGFMTEEAWLEIAPTISKGLREAPVVREKPDWWMIKFIDGFGPHTSSLDAMQIYYDAKILLLKEEGDASHVNQAYDQEVAKNDKITMRECLRYLRESEKLRKTVIDGWDLIHVGLAAVRELSPKSWVVSFKRVNLHPSHRVSFSEWCDRISGFLQAGQSFRQETHDVDAYTMLPTFWHGMSTEEKSKCLDILKSHEYAYSPACLAQLHSEVRVPLSDMQQLRMCMHMAMDNPGHVQRGVPDHSALHRPALADAVIAERQRAPDVADGLSSFQLHPTREGKRILKGKELFDHMVRFARRSTSSSTELKPSAHLDVQYSATQQKLLDPTAQDFTMHEIIAHSHGAGAQQALAKRKLDALGNIRGASGFANDPERLKALKAQLDISVSLADIAKATAAAEAEKKSQLTAELIQVAPEALIKLKQKAGVPMSLTKHEIRAIAFACYGGIVLKESQSKPVLAAELAKLMAANPRVLEEVVVPAHPPQPQNNKRQRAATAEGGDTEIGGGATTITTRHHQPRATAGHQRPRSRGAGEDSSSEESEEGEDEEESEEGGEEGEEEGGGGAAGDLPTMPAGAAGSTGDGGAALLVVPVGMKVHIPCATFPTEEPTPEGYWVGKTVVTRMGGTGDIGIKVPGEPIFTRPLSEVAAWVVV